MVEERKDLNLLVGQKNEKKTDLYLTWLVLNLKRVRHGELCCARQVVDDQMDEVLLLNAIPDFARSFGVPGLLVAKNLTVDTLVHLDFVGRVADPVASQDLSQVFRLVDPALRGLAEGEGVVLIGKLSVAAGHLDGFQSDLAAFLEVGRGHPGNVKTGRAEIRDGEDKHQEDDGGFHA